MNPASYPPTSDSNRRSCVDTPTNATNTLPTRVNATARDRSLALSAGSTVSRSDRAKLSSDDKRKFYTAATAKLTPLFSLTDETIDINSGSFLEKNHDVFLQLNHLKQHLTSYCMVDVFSIVTSFDATTGAPDDSNPKTIIDYFEHYLEVTEEQILASIMVLWHRHWIIACSSSKGS